MMVDLTTTIRQLETNHIIFLLGNCWGGNYNGMLPPWDSNLVIGFHKCWDVVTRTRSSGERPARRKKLHARRDAGKLREFSSMPAFFQTAGCCPASAVGRSFYCAQCS